MGRERGGVVPRFQGASLCPVQYRSFVAERYPLPAPRRRSPRRIRAGHRESRGLRLSSSLGQAWPARRLPVLCLTGTEPSLAGALGVDARPRVAAKPDFLVGKPSRGAFAAQPTRVGCRSAGVVDPQIYFGEPSARNADVPPHATGIVTRTQARSTAQFRTPWRTSSPNQSSLGISGRAFTLR